MHGSHVNQLESHSFSVFFSDQDFWKSSSVQRFFCQQHSILHDSWGANLLDESLVVLRRLPQHHLRYLRQCWHREGSIHTLLPNQDVPTPKIKHPANICQISIVSTVSTIEKIVRLILPKKSHCPLSLGFVALLKPKHTPFLQKNMFNEWIVGYPVSNKNLNIISSWFYPDCILIFSYFNPYGLWSITMFSSQITIFPYIFGLGPGLFVAMAREACKDATALLCRQVGFHLTARWYSLGDIPHSI